MSSIAIAGCVAFVWSLAFLDGLAFYAHLSGRERAFPQSNHPVLAICELLFIAVLLLGAGCAAFFSGTLLDICTFVFFVAALNFAVWLYRAKYRTRYIETLLLLINAGALALAAGLLSVGLITLVLPLYPDFFLGDQVGTGNLIFLWLGVFSGPLVWEFVLGIRQEVLSWLRNFGKDENSTVR